MDFDSGIGEKRMPLFHPGRYTRGPVRTAAPANHYARGYRIIHPYMIQWEMRLIRYV